MPPSGEPNLVTPLPGRSTLPAPGEDGLLQPLPQIVGQFVNFVAAVDLDCFPRGTQRDLAVFAASQMFFEVGPERNGRILIEHFIQLR
jgi:hypothetical protein